MTDSVSNMITQGVITNTIPDDQQYPRLQYTHHGKPRPAFVMQPCGFSSVAPIGFAVTAFSIENQAENKAVITSNIKNSKTRTPVQPMVAGEVVTFNPLTNTYSFYDKSGNLVVNIKNNHEVTIAKDQNVTIGGDGNATIGGALNITVTGDANITAATATITTIGDTTIDAPTVKITGDLEVDGDIIDQAQTNPKSVKDIRNAYDPHTHIESGGGTTQTPIPQI
jgi:phage baseplate assembly protein gpV